MIYSASFNKILRFQGDIVTQTPEQARVVQAAIDCAAWESGANAWVPSRAIALRHWLAMHYEQLILEPQSNDLMGHWPLATQTQEQFFWERAIDSVATFSGDDAARAVPMMRAARALIYEWQLGDRWAREAQDEGVQTFIDAHRKYAEVLRDAGFQDAVDLAAALSRTSERRAAQSPWLSHGFINPPPLYRTLVARRANQVELATAPPDRAEIFDDASEEIGAAFTWAEQCASEPGARVAIVARQEWMSHPATRRAIAALAQRNIGVVSELRTSAATQPLIGEALALLAWEREASWLQWSQLIRAVSISGAREEASARAIFDTQIRAKGRYRLTVSEVMSELERHPDVELLRITFKRVLELSDRAPAKQSVQSWLRHFETLLNVCGWPGDQPWSVSQELQVRVWRQAVAQLAELHGLLGEVSRREALARLRKIVAALTMPRAGHQRNIYLVGLEAAFALQPTCVWVARLNHNALLPLPKTSALIPRYVQRHHQVPGTQRQAERAAQVALYRALFHGAQCSVISISPDSEGLISIPVSQFPEFDGQAKSARADVDDGQSVALEAISDYRGAALETREIKRGITFFADQAACPFRAYARHRLNARALEEPQPGVSPLDRGRVVHHALALFWARVRTSNQLRDMAPNTRAELIESAVEDGIRTLHLATDLDRELWLLERQRLKALIEEWLSVEMGREGFQVKAVEQSGTVRIADFNFRVRVDRVDVDAEDRGLLIDYKTGQTAARDWEVPRPDSPQLPLYAVSEAVGRVEAIAYGKVVASKMSLKPYPPREAESAVLWQEQLDQWRDAFEALAGEMRNGHAAVMPKYGYQTCRHCDLMDVCRVATGLSAADRDHE
ncbi:MAG: PD-(D/E)XK nuclease family protein [Pseudomonadota bacterium]